MELCLAITSICSCKFHQTCPPLGDDSHHLPVNGERPHAQDEGAIIAQGAARIPPAQKTVLGKHFWGRGYFSTTNGAITEDVVLVWMPAGLQGVLNFVNM